MPWIVMTDSFKKELLLSCHGRYNICYNTTIFFVPSTGKKQVFFSVAKIVFNITRNLRNKVIQFDTAYQLAFVTT